MAVDTWRGTLIEEHIPEVIDGLYDQFLSNVIHTGLCDKIRPIRMESHLAATHLSERGETFDLIFIDATHNYEECKRDIASWRPLVRPGGILCGDDLLW